jgi:hypothetical protein
MMRDDESGSKSNGADGKGNDRPRGKPVPEELKARVRKIAYEALAPRAQLTTNLYLDSWSVPRGTDLGASFESWTVERDSVLCFADFEPQANFAHPCSYFLHDAGTGELVRRVSAQFPPYPLEGLRTLDLFHEAKRLPEAPLKEPPRGGGLEARMQPLLAAADTASAMGRRYAILFSGVSDPHHLNDLELCLRMLKSFGFAANDIFVLFHNGTQTSSPFLDKQGHRRTWPGSTDPLDNQFTLTPTGKGSRKAFNAVLNQLSQKLQPGDLVYIHTEGHGGIRYGTGGGQYLHCLADGPGSTDRYFDFQMQADLQQIQGYDSLLVVMNQCFSGGFVDAVLAGSKAQRTYFTAACEWNRMAYATSDLKWNRFSRNWIEREKLNDADGKVEAREAYVYCDDDAVRGPDTPLDGRMPPPGANNQSPADEIVLR